MRIEPRVFEARIEGRETMEQSRRHRHSTRCPCDAREADQLEAIPRSREKRDRLRITSTSRLAEEREEKIAITSPRAGRVPQRGWMRLKRWTPDGHDSSPVVGVDRLVLGRWYWNTRLDPGETDQDG